MKKPIAFFASLILLLPLAAQADTRPINKYQWPPIWNGEGYSSTMPLTHYAFDIVDTFNTGSTDMSFIRVGTPGPQPFCKSLDDKSCESEAKRYSWWIIRVLPVCESVTDNEDCIESLSLVASDGSVKKLKYLKTLAPNSWPKDIKHKLGAGSGKSLWVEEGSETTRGYMVTVSGNAGNQFGATEFPLGTLSASIVPYEVKTGDYHLETTKFVNRTLQGQGKDINCLWTDEGQCGFTIDFEAGSKLELSMHLPKRLTSWLFGRLQEPEIRVEELSGNTERNRLIVRGSGIQLPMIGAKVAINEANDAVKALWANNNCPECEHGIWAVNGESSNLNNQMLEAFKPWIGDKAMLMMPTWSISSMAGGGSKVSNCSQGSSKLFGLITTNASLYSPEPPIMKDNQLDYQVSGLHYKPDGSVFEGTYNLAMTSKGARCVYGFSNAPIQASISVTTADGVQKSFQTTTVNEKNGWMYLSAAGFTFSSPRIKIKLTQLKSSLTCVKGSKSKIVKGSNPRCPSGYLKK